MRERLVRLFVIFVSSALLACNVSAMASGDDPSDQPSDPADDRIALDSSAAPAFNPALLSQESTAGQGAPLPENAADAEGEGGAAGSNPLASVNKLDLIWSMTGAGGSDTHDVSAEGAFMLRPKLAVGVRFNF
jgi:hypothetical protein